MHFLSLVGHVIDKRATKQSVQEFKDLLECHGITESTGRITDTREVKRFLTIPIKEIWFGMILIVS